MKYLFIGGSQDGKRMELPEALPFIQVPKPRKLPQRFSIEKREPTFAIEAETYQRVRLRDTDKEYIVFQLVEDNTSVIARLLAEYHPEK